MTTVDAVEIKRQGAARAYDLVKDMTLEEEVAFWCEKTEELRQLQATRPEEHALRIAA
jgi:hypothetical protein